MLDATPLLRLYAAHLHRALQRQDAVETQQRVLLNLVHRAEATRFGREHGFPSIRSITDFQARVPLRTYDDFWKTYWQEPFPRIVGATWPGPIPYFALTSGTTTGKTKYIPVSTEMIAANRRAALELLTHHVRRHPRTRLLAGRSCMLGGSTALSRLASGVVAGDLSGIAALTMPWWARLRYFPPRQLERMTDWEEKIARLAELAPRSDIRSISGTPSWLLLFFDKLASLRPSEPRRLKTFFPHLELIVHGGINFAPYRPLFADWLAGSEAETREVYPASEGFVALADQGDGDGLRLLLDNGLFFEFVPVAELETSRPTRHWIQNVETDRQYALVLSSCAGLWSYVLGDTVRFVERSPPRIVVTGRTTQSLSAFGEHLIVEELDDAIAEAAADIAAPVAEYSVVPAFPLDAREAGYHLYFVEFAAEQPPPALIERFLGTIDACLLARNADYAAHRAGDYGLGPPAILIAPRGAFAAWMKSRGKLGGQNKVPRVIQDPAMWHNLHDFIEQMRQVHPPAGDHRHPDQ